MKRVFLIILAVLLLLSPGLVAAAHDDIVVVQSSRLQPYEEALAGFRQTWGSLIPRSGPKAILPGPLDVHVLSEEPDRRQLLASVRERQPDLIVAIGTNSLALVKGITAIPVLYLMVPYPEEMGDKHDNLHGIGMRISPARQLTGLLDVFPASRRLGVVYDPGRSSALLEEMREAAAREQVSLVVRSVSTAREVPAALDDLVGFIDAYWMLPDQTVVTPQTVEAMLLVSLEHRIPILTFSEKYVKLGATLTVTFDIFDMGRQAAEMAGRILSGQPVSDVEPGKVKISVNQKVEEKLGVKKQAAIGD